VTEQGLRELDLGTKQVICRIERRVAVVILNRPEARNALTLEIKEALHAVVPRLGDDPAVGCVLLTGAGGAFCAGGDTKVMAEAFVQKRIDCDGDLFAALRVANQLEDLRLGWVDKLAIFLDLRRV